MSAPISKWAERYIQRYDWQLVPIEPNRKFPRTANWGNNTLQSAEIARAFYESRSDWNMGVALGPSRMCSLDIDCFPSFEIICEAFGVDLGQLVKDHPTIQGQAPGMRVMFRIPAGVELPYIKLNWRPESDPDGSKHRELMGQARELKKQAETMEAGPAQDELLRQEQELRELAKPFAMYTVFELRSACDGSQKQDVLPPSQHPETGEPYKWITPPSKDIPDVPEWLATIWTQFESKFKRQFQAACPWADIQKVYAKESKAPVTPREYSSDGGLVAAANTYARDIQVIDELSTQGYRNIHGARWLSPYSSTGLPGVVVFNDSNKCWIHHASDPLCSDATGKPVSSFDLYCEYEHGGNFVEAAKAAAVKLGIRSDAPARHESLAPDVGAGAGQLPPEAYVDGTPLEQPDGQHSGSFDYTSPLIWTKSNHKPHAHIDNLREILSRMGATVRYNVMRKEEELIFPGKQFSIDNEANASLAYLISACSLFEYPTDKVPEFLTFLADSKPYSPVVEWVKSKPWDGTDRLAAMYDTVRSTSCAELKRTIMLRWFVSAIAAAFSPHGVAAQGMMVFQGDQNIGKTRWLKSLVPADVNRVTRMVQDGVLLKPDDKDSVKQACSSWLVEVGELDGSFKKSDSAQLKAFITRDEDTMRRPYARKESTYARRTVFFGSVNPREYLQDDTGNRRYWTIECESVDSNHGIDMQQLWAQVYELWLAGEIWWLSDAEIEQLNTMNADHQTLDPIEDRLLSGFMWGARTDTWAFMRATDALIVCGLDRPTRSDVTRAGVIIRKLNGGQSKKCSRQGRMLLLPPVKDRYSGSGF